MALVDKVKETKEEIEALKEVLRVYCSNNSGGADVGVTVRNIEKLIRYHEFNLRMLLMQD